jgi:hypothetical protein
METSSTPIDTAQPLTAATDLFDASSIPVDPRLISRIQEHVDVIGGSMEKLFLDQTKQLEKVETVSVLAKC